MKKKQATAPKDQPSICFIVEGFTEMHYVNLLNELFDKTYYVYNCKGGGANGVLKKAQQFIEKNKENYNFFIIVYDTDTEGNESEKRKKEIKQDKGIYLERLNPCFEYCLLSHFQSPKGNSCGRVIDILKQNHITDYDKNDFDQLKKYLDKEKVEKMTEKYNCEAVKTYFINDTTNL